jgi:thiol-disulfide isomerase/thioredoxin
VSAAPARPQASAPRTWRQRWRGHAGTLALVLLVFFGVQAWQTRTVPAALDDALLDLPLTTLRPGAAEQTSSLRAELAALQQRHPGRNVAVYVWAEWCPICTTMQGTVDGVATDLPLITVAMQSGTPAAVARYQHSRGLAWHTLVDPRGQLAQGLGFGAVPGFAVVTPDGQLRWPTLGLTSGWGMRLRLWLA